MSTFGSDSSPYFTAQTGRFHGTTVPELLWALSRSRATGRLFLTRTGMTKSVSFEEGRILFAGSDDADERLGEMLVRDGLIHLEQLESASSNLGPGRRLGTALIEQGALSPDDLVRSVLAQVRSILANLIDWEEGEWRFENGAPSVGQGIQLGVSPAQLILEGVRQLRSFALLRKIVGPSRSRFQLAAVPSRLPAGVTLSEGEKLVLESLERGATSIESLCEALVLSSFEVHQVLAAFCVLGVIVPAPSEQSSVSDVRTRGTLDRRDFLVVLADLCRDGETGVLHVTRGTVERSFHVREGRCVFATSNDADDGLISHLFRRGVISLQDREEVGRRLLTNRRVGTLLLELGVLDETDLVRAVRSQIKLIVLDSARWQDGTYAFAAGELPTLEGIVLEDSLEDLVLASARNVTSWSQVVKGVGGLDARLIVAPGYLEALDRMTVGSDTWDLVAALTEPRTVREVCRSSPEGDFRTSQTLWALRILGIVADAPAPVADAAQPALEATAPAAPTSSLKSDASTATLAGVAQPSPSSIEFERVSAAQHDGSESAELGAESKDSSVAPLEPARESVAEAPAALLQSQAATVERVEGAEPPAASAQTDAGPSDRKTAAEPAAVSTLDETTPSASAAAAPATEASKSSPPSPPPEEVNQESSDVGQMRAEVNVSTNADRPAAETPQPELSLAPPVCPVAEVAPAVTYPLDPELERQIERFNLGQQIVYRVVRAEVGAGASNFVRFCGIRLADGFNELFAGVDLMDDGTWDPVGIRDAVNRKAVLDPWLGFQRLLEKEIEMVQVHLGAAQADVLRKRLEEFDRAGATF